MLLTYAVWTQEELEILHAVERVKEWRKHRSPGWPVCQLFVGLTRRVTAGGLIRKGWSNWKAIYTRLLPWEGYPTVFSLLSEYCFRLSHSHSASFSHHYFFIWACLQIQLHALKDIKKPYALQWHKQSVDRKLFSYSEGNFSRRFSNWGNWLCNVCFFRMSET